MTYPKTTGVLLASITLLFRHKTDAIRYPSWFAISIRKAIETTRTTDNCTTAKKKMRVLPSSIPYCALGPGLRKWCWW